MAGIQVEDSVILVRIISYLSDSRGADQFVPGSAL